MNEVAAGDLYAVLGVARDASAREIRRAYRRVARRCHPDLNRHPDGPGEFARLAHAYEILHDPARRARYDRSTRQPAPASPPSEVPTVPVPSAWAGVRRGILELSPAEALHVAHCPLALRVADGHLILLPAGTGHGDQITVADGVGTAVLTVRTDRKT